MDLLKKGGNKNMRVKIRLDKMADINKFVNICSAERENIYLTDGNNYTVSAKSILGALCSLEWNELWCVSDIDIYNKLKEFIIE